MRNQTLIENLRTSLSETPKNFAVNLGLNGTTATAKITTPLQNLEKLQKSAVLITLIINDEQISVFLTQRSEKISYPRIWCFPGGKLEEQDNQDLVETALREAVEETGMPKEKLDVLGYLPPCHNRKHMITPVIAVLNGPFTPTIDPNEVMSTIEIPLAHILDPKHYETKEWNDKINPKLYDSFTYAAEHIKNDIKFLGITASILRYLHDFMINKASALDWQPEVS